MRIITILMTNMSNYVRDPKEITRLSFAAIRREADLTAVPEDIMPLALRMIHACGMVDLVDDIAFSEGAGVAGRDVARLHSGDRRSMAPSPSRCAGSRRSVSPMISRQGCPPTPRRRRPWDAS
jgi:hypothetical protein